MSHTRGRGWIVDTLRGRRPSGLGGSQRAAAVVRRSCELCPGDRRYPRDPCPADGVVRNGNRRLAMLKRLQREEGLEGFEYVDAVMLNPDQIDEVALFDMEQREQLTENLKVRYTEINLLLAIRDAAEGRGIIWSDSEDIDRVAGELQYIIGNDQRYAVVQLNAIKYMD